MKYYKKRAYEYASEVDFAKDEINVDTAKLQAFINGFYLGRELTVSRFLRNWEIVAKTKIADDLKLAGEEELS